MMHELELPGTAPDVASMLRRKAAASLKPNKPTLPCDIGLFSDDARALDLVDLVRAAERVTDPMKIFCPLVRA